MWLIRNGYVVSTRRGFLGLLFSALLALALFVPGAATAQELKQIKLTDKHIQGFMAAYEDIAKVYDGAESDKPEDPEVQAQAAAVAKKHGFASLAQFAPLMQDQDSPAAIQSPAVAAARPEIIASTPFETERGQPITAQLPSNPREPFEGVWAQSKEECLDEEGPNSRTEIDLNKQLVDSEKPTALFDQYENHCRIDEKVASAGDTTTLVATCFEFWEYFLKRTNGVKTSIKLSLGKNGSLEINGETYRRCQAKCLSHHTSH